MLQFSPKEKSCPQSPFIGTICVVQPSQYGWYALYTIADPEKMAEFFSPHKLLLFRPLMGLYWHGHGADTFMELRPVAGFVRTAFTLLPFEGCIASLGFPSRISTGFWFISGRTFQCLCPGFVELKISKFIVLLLWTKPRLPQGLRLLPVSVHTPSCLCSCSANFVIWSAYW